MGDWVDVSLAPAESVALTVDCAACGIGIGKLDGFSGMIGACKDMITPAMGLRHLCIDAMCTCGLIRCEA